MGWDIWISNVLETFLGAPSAAAGPFPDGILTLMMTLQLPPLLTSFDKRTLHIDRRPHPDFDMDQLTYLMMGFNGLERPDADHISPNTLAAFQGFKALERPNIILGRFITDVSRPWRSPSTDINRPWRSSYTKLLVHLIEGCQIDVHESLKDRASSLFFKSPRSIRQIRSSRPPLENLRGYLYWSLCTHDSAILVDTELRDWLSEILTHRRPVYLIVGIQTYEDPSFKHFLSITYLDDTVTSKTPSEKVLAICIRKVREVHRPNNEGESSLVLEDMQWIKYTGLHTKPKGIRRE